MPGRLWDGKEAVLAALASLAKGCPKSLGSDGGGRIVAALLEATGDEVYRLWEQIYFVSVFNHQGL